MRILHVEDNPAMRRAMYATLRRNGFEVAQAVDGRNALRMAREDLPDLVLLDLQLPGISGVEVCRQLKALPGTAAIPVVMLTAHAGRSHVEAAIEAGACEYLVKGRIRLPQMLERIRKVLEQRGPKPASSIGNAAANPGAPRSDVPASPAAPAAPDVRVDRGALMKELDERASLKAMPFVLAEVLAITSSEESSVDELGKALQRDPVISAQVLKLANSALYGRHGRITTIAESVKRIGFNGIRNLAVGLSVVDKFSSSDTAGLDRTRFWVHSLGVAVIARELAGGVDGLDPDELFVIGLLHDLGKAFFDESFPDPYGAVIQHARERGARLFELEKKAMGTTHQAVARRLLEGWRLPEQISDPILRHHHEQHRILKWRSGHLKRVGAVLVIANTAAKALGLGDSGDDLVDPIASPLAREVGVTGQILLDRLDAVREQVRALVEILFLHGRPAAPLDALIGLCGGAGPRVLYLDYDPPHLDPIRLAIARATDQVREATSFEVDRTGAPDLLVIHTRSPEQREQREQDLARAAEAGLLPEQVALVGSPDAPASGRGYLECSQPGPLRALAAFLRSRPDA